MLGLQKVFDETLHKLLEPNNVLTLVLENKLKDIGIIITDDQRECFRKRFENIEDCTLHFDFSDEQVKNSGVYSEEYLRPKLEDIASNLVKSVEKLANNMDNVMHDIVMGVTDSMCVSVRETLRERMDDMLDDQEAMYLGFAAEVQQVWGDGLKLLQGYIVMFDEVAQEYFKKIVDDENKNTTLKVVIMLQAKASQTAKEILTLLRNGFADGAKARWRYLHELAVIAAFVNDHGDKVAERYIKHEAIEHYKAAIQYNELHKKLDLDVIPDEYIEELKADYDDAIKEYGDSYKEEFGWASDSLGLNRPRFGDIERSVNLEGARPYYRNASYNIHACPTGILQSLGLYQGENLLLAGPSHIGLSDPARLTAISLSQISAGILTENPDIDSIVVCKIMIEYGKEVEDKFIQIESAIAASYQQQE